MNDTVNRAASGGGSLLLCRPRRARERKAQARSQRRRLAAAEMLCQPRRARKRKAGKGGLPGTHKPLLPLLPAAACCCLFFAACRLPAAECQAICAICGACRPPAAECQAICAICAVVLCALQCVLNDHCVFADTPDPPRERSFPTAMHGRTAYSELTRGLVINYSVHYNAIASCTV